MPFGRTPSPPPAPRPEEEGGRGDGGPGPALEDRSVQGWRYRELVRAGFTPQQAAALADRRDVDLHHACALVRARGCPPHLAFDILS